MDNLFDTLLGRQLPKQQTNGMWAQPRQAPQPPGMPSGNMNPTSRPPTLGGPPQAPQGPPGGFQQGPGPEAAPHPLQLPNTRAQVPPRWQRFMTAQEMANNVRNDWQPPPMLTRLLNSRVS